MHLLIKAGSSSGVEALVTTPSHRPITKVFDPNNITCFLRVNASSPELLPTTNTIALLSIRSTRSSLDRRIHSRYLLLALIHQMTRGFWTTFF